MRCIAWPLEHLNLQAEKIINQVIPFFASLFNSAERRQQIPLSSPLHDTFKEKKSVSRLLDIYQSKVEGVA